MPYTPLPRRVRFGRFELDAVDADLRKDGRRVRIRPQALTLLALLVDRAGTLVTREELRASLWPDDTFVDFDHGLNATIAEVRRTLSDTPARAGLIETVPRKGYRFVADVTVVDASRLRRRQSDVQPAAPAPDSDGRAGSGAPAAIAAAAPAPTGPGLATDAPRGRSRRWTWRALAPVGVAALLLLLAVTSIAEHLPWQRTDRAAIDGSIPEVARRPGGTSQPDAWQAYARARVHWANRNDCTRAVQGYREALAHDPDFALAWVGIADCYTINANRDEAARALAEAQARAEDLGEVHASRGLLRMFLSWDWAGAEESFTHAVQRAPEYPQGWQWAGVLALLRGDLSTARDRLARAAALDPGSPRVAADLGLLEVAAGRPERALAHCRQAQRLSAGHEVVGVCFEAAWLRLGRPDEVYSTLTGTPPPSLPQAARLLHAHYMSKTQRALAHRPVSHSMIAGWYAAVGRDAEALRHLEIAVSAQEFMAPFAVLDPRFDSVRSSPAFRALMDRAGLPPREAPAP